MLAEKTLLTQIGLPLVIDRRRAKSLDPLPPKIGRFIGGEV